MWEDTACEQGQGQSLRYLMTVFIFNGHSQLSGQTLQTTAAAQKSGQLARRLRRLRIGHHAYLFAQPVMAFLGYASGRLCRWGSQAEYAASDDGHQGFVRLPRHQAWPRLMVRQL